MTARIVSGALAATCFCTHVPGPETLKVLMFFRDDRHTRP